MSRLESNPIMIKERASMVWLPFGNVEVMDGAFVLVDKDGVRIQVPVGGWWTWMASCCVLSSRRNQPAVMLFLKARFPLTIIGRFFKVL